jgi:hypothetical protein
MKPGDERKRNQKLIENYQQLQWIITKGMSSTVLLAGLLEESQFTAACNVKDWPQQHLGNAIQLLTELKAMTEQLVQDHLEEMVLNGKKNKSSGTEAGSVSNHSGQGDAAAT